MTTLQHMVYSDALKRMSNEYPSRTLEVSAIDAESFNIPSDKEIKENGYEGAVEHVLQQMNSVGMI